MRLGTDFALQAFGSAVVHALVLFAAAGTLAWPAGWVFFLMLQALGAALGAWLLRHRPELLRERLHGLGKAGQGRWDRLFVGLLVVAWLAWLALMALDAARFHWSVMPVALRALGVALTLAGDALFFLTFRENAFLSPAVRVQRERAQTVVSTGPYRLVRHPMYAAFALFACGTALLLGSWWGLLGGLGMMGMLAWRAVREERVLRHELPGYAAYLERVRWRLVPGVW